MGQVICFRKSGRRGRISKSCTEPSGGSLHPSRQWWLDLFLVAQRFDQELEDGVPHEDGRRRADPH
jgi:hypothetical protein